MIAVIKLVPTTTKLFPYDLTHDPNTLPVANTANILRLVTLVEDLGINEIYVLGSSISNTVRSELFTKTVKYISDINQIKSEYSHILQINGNDYVTKEDLASLIEQYRANPNQYVMVKPLDRFNRAYENFGVKVHETQVKKIYGHARDHYVDYLLSSIGIFGKKVYEYEDSTALGFQAIVSGGMPFQKLYFENVLNTSIERGETFSIVVAQFPLLVLDSPWNLFEANVHEAAALTDALKKHTGTYETDGTALIEGFLKVGNNVKIEKNVIIKGNCILGDNVTLTSGAIIEEGCIIGNNTIVSDYAKLGKNTVIGNQCKVGYNSEIVGVFMDGASAIHNCEMYGIVGRSVDVAAGCIAAILRFDDQVAQITHEGKRYGSLFTNAVFVGDYTRTGINNTFYPGLRIGAYCAIGPGAIIEKDVAHNTLVQVTQQKEFKPWKSDRYGWK